MYMKRQIDSQRASETVLGQQYPKSHNAGHDLQDGIFVLKMRHR